VGFFGTYEFDGTAWSASDPTGPSHAATYLWLDIHDSDFATVRYAPAGSGSGVAYLGFTPSVYFDMEGESEPTDVEREARGLAEWWAAAHPEASAAEVDQRQAQIVGFLASDDPPDVDALIAQGDIFVEDKARRFLAALDLPLPAELGG
jgi:hypothetical protein